MKNSLFFSVICATVFLGFASCLQNVNVSDDSEFESKGELQSIRSSDYDRFLLLKTTSKDYCQHYITEYCELNVLEEQKDTANNFNFQHFRVAQKGMWLIVEVPKTLGFYEFHNLVGWLDMEGESDDFPSEVYGISINKNNNDLSYYVKLEMSNQWSDLVVGANKKGNSLSVYLPDAYMEGGNMKVKRDNNHEYNDLISKLYIANIDLSSTDYLIWEDFDVKLYY